MVEYKHYYNCDIPELEEINKWTVFTKFNLSDNVHFFYIKEAEIIAYALITQHIQTPILNGEGRIPNIHYLLDYLEVHR